MQKGTNFCLSGFHDEDLQKQIKTGLINLGCVFHQKLAQVTNILVVYSTWTEKFKIAKLHKNSITCVTKKWAEDSIKKQTLLAPDKYIITQKEMFLGMNIAICGFPLDNQHKIQKIIKERQGKAITSYRAIDIIRKHNDLPEIIHVILASNDQIQRAKHAKIPNSEDKIPPLVRLEWLQDSLKRKRCKFPEDYAVNLINIEATSINLKRLIKNLNNFMQNDIMDKSGDFLEDTMIYIDKNLRMDVAKILKSLISVCGGYWTDNFTSVVTHVLLSWVDETTYQEFKKYGNRIYIVRPQWLIDSICLYNRLDQEDYFIRCFKISNQVIRSILYQETMRNNQNSQNFNSLPGVFDSRIPVNSNTQPIQIESQKKRNIHLRTDIFKGRNFYFPPEVVNEPFYLEMNKTIRISGGQTFDKINSKMSVFVVLKDSPKIKEISDNMIRAKYKFFMVSDRWIKECLKKNCFIEPEVNTYYHFKAFSFNTPMNEFHRYVFDIIGYDMLVTSRIRELLTVMGSTKTNPNNAELTHILCGPDWQSNQSREKINKKLKQKQNIKLISSNWLFDSINQRKIIAEQKYYLRLQTKNPHKTPRKKEEQNTSGSSNNKSLKSESRQIEIKIE